VSASPRSQQHGIILVEVDPADGDAAFGKHPRQRIAYNGDKLRARPNDRWMG
jgi:hypothetical protein